MDNRPLRKVLYSKVRDEQEIEGYGHLVTVPSLSTKISDALSHDNFSLARNPQKRILSLETGRQCVLGPYSDNKDGFYGTLYEFEPGGYQAVLKFVDEMRDQPEVNLVEVSQYKTQPGQEFIQNWVYFYIRNNNICFIQSRNIGANIISNYCNFLLKESSIIDSDKEISLKTQFDLSLLGKDRGKIKSVQVGNTIIAPMNEDRQEQSSGKFVETTKEEKIGGIQKSIGAGSYAINQIAIILGCTQHEAESLIEDRAPDTELLVRAQVIAKTRNKEWRQKFYREVEAIVQGMDHSQIKLSTSTGTINGQKAILSDDQKFTMTGSLPILAEAWATLRKVYERWVEDDKIEI